MLDIDNTEIYAGHDSPLVLVAPNTGYTQYAANNQIDNKVAVERQASEILPAAGGMTKINSDIPKACSFENTLPAIAGGGSELAILATEIPSMKQFGQPLINTQEVYGQFAKEYPDIASCIITASSFENLLPAVAAGASDSEILAAKVSSMKQVGQLLIKTQETYEQFAGEYPDLADYGLKSASAIVQTMISGPMGLANFVRAELMGLAINEVAGAEIANGIGHIIDAGSESLLSKYPELEHKEARAITAAALIIPTAAADGTSGLKEVFTQIKIKKNLLPTVEVVGNRFPINAAYANKTMHMDDVSPKFKKDYPDLKEKYPHGVAFDEKGFPRFEPYATHTVRLEKFSGNYDMDFKEANKAAGLKTIPADHTWHHHEDGKTMLLVPKDLHRSVSHTGGMAIHRANEKKAS